MKILQVVHGYPPEYNAGSENYTKTITEELLKRGNEVFVFSREENPFLPEYSIRRDVDNKNTPVRYTINLARTKDRYLSQDVNAKLRGILETVKPDIVHFQHLNHLSITLPSEVKKMNIPSVYTLHDFWLMCPRGQFIQLNLKGEPWNLCDGQEDSKCAQICYSRYFTGMQDERKDVAYWTDWVNSRMEFARKVVRDVDLFISPSKTVIESFRSSFPSEAEKVSLLDYGFNLNKLSNRIREKEEQFVFGYIGTHIPAKGVDYLIRAFAKMKIKAKLRIWGRYRSDSTTFLRKLSEEVSADNHNPIEWMGEFNGDKIVEEVFNKVDAIVVPSIWMENSPLVIHESQQAGVPVITAAAGGMKEYVENERNGLLFDFRSIESLTMQMEKLARNPEHAKDLGSSRYLYSNTGDVQSVEFHVDRLMEIYTKLTHKS